MRIATHGEIRPLSRPRIHLVRIAVFLGLCGFLCLILNRQLLEAFKGNPGLNALILGLLAIGIVLAVRQVFRLFREVRWVNYVSGADPKRLAKPPILLAPLASILGEPGQRTSLPVATIRSLLDSVAARLDENRELVRYLAGLLVFLGLLGTFWGLIDTVNSVGRIISSLRTGAEAAVLFDELKNALAAPLGGMGVAFSASLFGLASSLVLGFLDLQAGQAQNRFYTELEDWLTTNARLDGAVRDGEAAEPSGNPRELASALRALADAVSHGPSGRSGGEALAELAGSLQSLVSHLRSEQKLLRDLIEAQAQRDKELRTTLDRIASRTETTP